MPSYSLDIYYQILGLAPGASEAELKQAYRRRAKQLHPDRNKSPHAQQDFILLTEAYDYFLHHGTALIIPSQPSYSPPDQSQQSYQQTAAQRETEQVRTRARQRAAQHANMSYDDFVGTDDYKSLVSVEIVIRYLFILATMLFLVGIATALLITGGWIGALFAICFLLVPGRGLYAILFEQSIDLTEFHEALMMVIQSRGFQIAVISIFNVFAFLRFGLYSLIEPGWLVGSYLIAIGLIFFVTKTISPARLSAGWRYYTLCIAPLIIGLLFTINYLLTGTVMTEKYEYINSVTDNGHNSTEIHLPDHVYDQYPTIRIFADYDQMIGTSVIRYKFATGILGIKVMKGYKFQRKDEEEL